MTNPKVKEIKFNFQNTFLLSETRLVWRFYCGNGISSRAIQGSLTRKTSWSCARKLRSARSCRRTTQLPTLNLKNQPRRRVSIRLGWRMKTSWREQNQFTERSSGYRTVASYLLLAKARDQRRLRFNQQVSSVNIQAIAIKVIDQLRLQSVHSQFWCSTWHQKERHSRRQSNTFNFSGQSWWFQLLHTWQQSKPLNLRSRQHLLHLHQSRQWWI